MISQLDRVKLALLGAGTRGINSLALAEQCGQRASGRVGELRQQGFLIESKKCANPKDGVIYVYRGMDASATTPRVSAGTWERCPDGEITVKTMKPRPGLDDRYWAQEVAEHDAHIVGQALNGRKIGATLQMLLTEAKAALVLGNTDDAKTYLDRALGMVEATLCQPESR